MGELKYDFDGDGHAEIPVRSPWGLGLLKLTSSGLSSTVLTPNGTYFDGWMLDTVDNRFDLVGDFDGDGRAEVLVISPWGIVLLRQDGSVMTPVVMAANGTRFGGWLLNSLDNRFGPVGDFDGDGCTEILVTSPWGIGIFKLSSNTFSVSMMAQNGTRLDGWLLNTADNRFSPVGDTDGDGREEVLVTSPWGIGLLQLNGAMMSSPVMAPNGTRFGDWLLNTADNHVVTLADLDGDGRDEIVITSPWGLGVLKREENTFISSVIAQNGDQFDGWLLNTLDDRILCAADLDGDGKSELFVTSPWGIAVFKLAGSGIEVPVMAANGTLFDGWLINTADNQFSAAADFNGDGHADLLATSSWGIGVLSYAGDSFHVLYMAPNGTSLGGWLLNTADNQFELGEQTVRLHVKVLTAPTIAIERMIDAMQRVYEGVGIRVQHVSTEVLNLPALLDIDVGDCMMGTTTEEQNRLFANRNHAWGSDVVVYFVRSTIPIFNGCAAFPVGQPGAVVASIATVWTLGHEVGHVLGLPHVDDNDRLMTGNGTRNITNIPPDLIAAEVSTMRASSITFKT